MNQFQTILVDIQNQAQYIFLYFDHLNISDNSFGMMQFEDNCLCQTDIFQHVSQKTWKKKIPFSTFIFVTSCFAVNLGLF